MAMVLAVVMVAVSMAEAAVMEMILCGNAGHRKRHTGCATDYVTYFKYINKM